MTYDYVNFRYGFNTRVSGFTICLRARHSGSPNWQLQKLLRIPVADVLNEPTQQRIVIRQLTPHHLLPDDVAKDATEIFVAGIRHERPRIGHHADKPREQTGVRESFKL